MVEFCEGDFPKTSYIQCPPLLTLIAVTKRNFFRKLYIHYKYIQIPQVCYIHGNIAFPSYKEQPSFSNVSPALKNVILRGVVLNLVSNLRILK